MDSIDHAQQENERHLERALGNFRSSQSSQQSANECVECGDLISSERQLAVPGVQTCVQCQNWRERNYARR